jgi:hypothetical protein
MSMKADRDVIVLARGNFSAEQIAAKLKISPQVVFTAVRRTIPADHGNRACE